MNYKHKLAYLGFFIVLMGCKKNAGEEPSTTDPLIVETSSFIEGSPQIISTGSNAVLPSQASLNYLFDWETARAMPGPSNNEPIPLPWADDTHLQYDDNLRYDYKKSDGWELVFNTFTLAPSQNNMQKIFVLYNKFRGVLRFYTYFELDWANSTRWSAYSNKLKLRGSDLNTNLLNFADQHIVDTDLSSGAASISGPFSLMRKSWYIAQYELAYDPKLAKRDVTSIFLDWGHDFTSSFSGELNRVNFTDVKFKIHKQDTDASLVNIDGELTVNVNNAAELEGLQKLFNAETITSLKQQIAGNEGYSNIYNGFIVSDADLMNIKTITNGNLSRGPEAVHYSSFTLAIPGYDNSKTIGVGPVFNESLGIFYLESKPEIILKSVPGTLSHEYTLDLKSVRYLFNPFLSKDADINNISQEIVAKDKESNKSLTEAKIYQGQQLRANKPLDIVGVRVSFDVVPKNGSNKVRIVKTFSARIVS